MDKKHTREDVLQSMMDYDKKSSRQDGGRFSENSAFVNYANQSCLILEEVTGYFTIVKLN